MNTLISTLLAFLAINILMDSTKINRFDIFVSRQMEELSIVDEGLTKYLQGGLAAGALSGAFSQTNVNNRVHFDLNNIPSIKKEIKMVGDYTYDKAKNIIARTLYDEARGEGKEGIDAVASVIYNRAGGKIEDMPKVCLAENQFSGWKGQLNITAPTYIETIPKDATKEGADKQMWEYIQTVVDKMLTGRFQSIIGDKNIYYAPSKVTPSWSNSIGETEDKGRHRFGYDLSQDGWKKKQTNTPPQPTKTPPPNTFEYTVKQKDYLGKIATQNKTTVKKILELNPEYQKDPNRLKIGAKLILPKG